MAKNTNETITLGSGTLYISEFTGTVPEISTICDDDNLLGWIKGGASIEYAPEYYEAKDDLGKVSKTVITTESATLKSGIMTWNGTTLSKLSETARVTEDTTTSHRRTLKVGGVGNANGKKYVLCFAYDDATDGDKWLLMVGKNQSGFTISFAQDAETVIDAEFKCLTGIDSDGTLFELVEELDVPASGNQEG